MKKKFLALGCLLLSLGLASCYTGDNSSSISSNNSTSLESSSSGESLSSSQGSSDSSLSSSSDDSSIASSPDSSSDSSSSSSTVEDPYKPATVDSRSLKLGIISSPTVLTGEDVAGTNMELASGDIFSNHLLALENQDLDFLLVSGDLTANGNKAEHEFVSSRLLDFDYGDTPVIVLPGANDDFSSYSSLYQGLYSEDEDNLLSSFEGSSAFRLAGGDEKCGITLLALNVASGIDDGLCAWIEEEMGEAAKRYDAVFALANAPLVSHYAGEEVVENSSELVSLLSSNGVDYVFSAGSTVQDTVKTSIGGKDFYDIETCSTVSYPSPARQATLTYDNKNKEVNLDYSTSYLDADALSSLGNISFTDNEGNLQSIDDLVEYSKEQISQAVLTEEEAKEKFVSLSELVADGQTLSQSLIEKGYTQEKLGESFLNSLYEYTNNGQDAFYFTHFPEEIASMLSLDLTVNTPKYFQDQHEVEDNDFVIDENHQDLKEFLDEPLLLRMHVDLSKMTGGEGASQFSVYTDAQGAGKFVCNLLDAIGNGILSNKDTLESLFDDNISVFDIDEEGHSLFDFLSYASNLPLYTSYGDEDKNIPSWVFEDAKSLKDTSGSNIVDSIGKVIPSALDKNITDECLFTDFISVCKTGNDTFGEYIETFNSILGYLTYDYFKGDLSPALAAMFVSSFTEPVYNLYSSYVDQVLSFENDTDGLDNAGQIVSKIA